MSGNKQQQSMKEEMKVSLRSLCWAVVTGWFFPAAQLTDF